jgi:transcriptional regulator with XRE-family HTH domain
MPLNMQELGKRIVAARGQRGWSQRELVRVSHVGQNNLSFLEQGKKPSVRADTVVRLAEALGVSADYLLGLTDTPTPPTKRPRPRKAAPVG